MPGQLVSFRNDRLGARLLSLVNTLRLVHDYDLDFAVYWPQDAKGAEAVFNRPADLFAQDFIDRHCLSRAEWMQRKQGILRIARLSKDGPDALVAALQGGEDVVVDQAFGVNVLEGEDEATVRAAFRARVGAVPYAEALKGPMATIDTALQGATAYHIRRGDLTDSPRAMHKPWPHKMVPNEFYEAHMARAMTQAGTAILFSDDAETLAHYTSAFPTLKTINDVLDLAPLNEPQRDFIELYAMSRCAKIIAPERSAFSATAADLGHAERRTVTEDMTDEMSRGAHECLLARLRDRPESFAGQGEIGQSLGHIGPYLEDQRRWREAADLFGNHVAKGLNIAFIYPQAMRFQHRANDVAGVLQSARVMRERPVVQNRYFAEAELHHGYGLIRAGRRTEGLSRVANGFWHDPAGGTQKLLLPALIETGLLNRQNFLIACPILMQLHRRKGPLRHLVTDFPEILKLPGVGIPTSLGTMDGAIWDWAPLLWTVSMKALARGKDFANACRQMERLEPSPEEALDLQGITALFAVFQQTPSEGVATLRTLAEENPAHTMTHLRLSHALWEAREWPHAAKAAEQAVAISDGAPALHAWAGMIAVRRQRADVARRHLQIAETAGIGLPSITMLLAQALEMDGAEDDARAMADRAVALAPLNNRCVSAQADMLARMGRLEGAIAALCSLVRNYRATKRTIKELGAFVREFGNPDTTRDVNSLIDEYFHHDPAMLVLMEESAA